MSNISCEDMGRVILQDISARSVARCESKASAALQATARLHFEQLHHRLVSMDETEWAISVYSYKQDATNDKRRKRSTLELDTGFLFGRFDEPGHATWESDAVTLKRLSDVLPITDETAAATLGVTLKAFSSLGCPSWDTIKTWNEILGKKVMHQFVFMCSWLQQLRVGRGPMGGV